MEKKTIRLFGGSIPFNDIFVLSGEMIEECGEDSSSYFFDDKSGYIAVFDGCGGIGARKYRELDNRTGAYIASHTLADYIEDYYASGKRIDADSIRARFTAALNEQEKKTTATAIKGSLSKSFPTTASMIFFKVLSGVMCADFIWAGDSRGFILNSDGLSQITTDDISEDEDALSNLTNDSRLTNVISASREYVLNHEKVKCPQRGVLISATDGCFAYFKTPMEFEYMIVEALTNASCYEEWQLNMTESIEQYTADDFTMAVVVYGYKDFKSFKRAYKSRKKFLYEKYISKLDSATDSDKQLLWDEYKEKYYRRSE